MGSYTPHPLPIRGPATLVILLHPEHLNSRPIRSPMMHKGRIDFSHITSSGRGIFNAKRNKRAVAFSLFTPQGELYSARRQIRGPSTSVVSIPLAELYSAPREVRRSGTSAILLHRVELYTPALVLNMRSIDFFHLTSSMPVICRTAKRRMSLSQHWRGI